MSSRDDRVCHKARKLSSRCVTAGSRSLQNKLLERSNMDFKPFHQKIYVGHLSLKGHKIFFEYDADFLKLGLPLSPFHLPLKEGSRPCMTPVFEGLFGVFNDSIPDGWGRLLLDRALVKHNINPGALTPLDRLCYVGSQGMGAFVYEPEHKSSINLGSISLDEISQEISEFQDHDEDRFVEDLLQRGGSSAGARPKVFWNLNNKHWLVKFPESRDPKDIGAVE